MTEVEFSSPVLGREGRVIAYLSWLTGGVEGRGGVLGNGDFGIYGV